MDTRWNVEGPCPIKVFYQEECIGEEGRHSLPQGRGSGGIRGCFRIQCQSSRSLHYRNHLKQHIPLALQQRKPFSHVKATQQHRNVFVNVRFLSGRNTNTIFGNKYSQMLFQRVVRKTFKSESCTVHVQGPSDPI